MNEDWARSVLGGVDLGPEPPSTVDISRAVWKGRKRLRVRRNAVAALGVGVVVLAVAVVPPSFESSWQTLPVSSPAPSTSPAFSWPAVETPPAPTVCRREPLAIPAGFATARAENADPSGRYIVGVAYWQRPEPEAVDPPGALVLWDNGVPSTWEPPLTGALGVDVNSAGTVLLVSSTEAGILRDGKLTRLASLGRYKAVAINSRGDVVGSWYDGAGVHPPVIWPAGQPDKPRELVGGDPGDHIIAGAKDIDDDGTVVGWYHGPTGRWDNITGPPIKSVARAVYWPASDGSARELPIPAGFGPRGQASSARGGLVGGDAARPDPDADRRGNRAVIWNLRTGSVTLEDRLGYVGVINRHGWTVGRAPMESGYMRPVAIFAGTVVPLPVALAPAADNANMVSLSDDGRVIAGSVRVSEGEGIPVRWLCS